MKKFIKALIIFTALSLILGATLAFAEGDEAAASPSVSLLFDEGAIHYVYDVEKPEGVYGNTVSVELYAAEPAEGVEPTSVLTEAIDKELDGKYYLSFKSSPVLPQDLRAPVWAKTVIKDQSGAVISESEVVRYSLFENAMKLFDKESDDQLELFKTLLDYSAAMQRTLYKAGIYTELDLTNAGGYADEYYRFIYNVYSDGELVSSEVTDYSKSTAIDLKADKALSGKVFAGFVDSDGNALREYGENTAPTHNKYTIVVNKPGTTTVSGNYTSEFGAIMTFDTHTSVSQYNVSITGNNTKFADPSRTALTVDKKGVASTTIVANSAHIALKTRGEEKYASFDKVIKVMQATVYPEGYEGTTDGAYKEGDIITSTTVSNTGMYLLNTSEVTNAAYHVFEADLMLASSHNTTTTQLTLQNSNSALLFGINFITSSGGKLNLAVFGGEDANRPINVDIPLRTSDWFNLRIEYYPLENDEMEIKIYLNGQYTGETFTVPYQESATAGDADECLPRVYLYHLNDMKNVTLAIDNVIITSYPKASE